MICLLKLIGKLICPNGVLSGQSTIEILLPYLDGTIVNFQVRMTLEYDLIIEILTTGYGDFQFNKLNAYDPPALPQEPREPRYLHWSINS